MTILLEQCREEFIAALTKPRGRDLQRKIGPSELGGCAYCLAYNMAKKLVHMPSREQATEGLASWVGTACHYWLEHNLELEGEVLHETKLKDIFEIPGYGSVGGTADLYVKRWERGVDFKFPGDFSFKKVEAALAKARMLLERGDIVTPDAAPSMQYRVQQQVYRKGFEKLGLKVVGSIIINVPRHLNDFTKILFWEEEPNDELLEMAIARANYLWELTAAGRLDEIPSGDDCYQCTHWRIGTRGDLTAYNALFN